MLLIINCFVALGQKECPKVNTDTAHHKKCWVIGFGPSFNTVGSDKFYPYNQYTAYVNYITDYREKIYTNALHDAFISFILDINLCSKSQTHSLGSGYGHQIINKNNIDYQPNGISNELFLYYQFIHRLYRNKNRTFYPFVGLQPLYTYKIIETNTSNETGILKNSIDEKSNSFFLRAPLGIVIPRNKFIFSINLTLNTIVFIIGSHHYIEHESSVLQSEKIDYNKFLMINELISQKYFFQNIQLKAGYIF